MSQWYVHFGIFLSDIRKVDELILSRCTPSGRQQSASDSIDAPQTCICAEIVLLLVIRFVEKSKEHLERKLTKMMDRMRALEDALAIAQAVESNQPHPLLTTSWRVDEDQAENEDGMRVFHNQSM